MRLSRYVTPFAFTLGTSLAASACLSDGISGPDVTGAPEGRPVVVTDASAVDVFIHGHQDDWQLFMGDRVYHALQAGHKIVLVYATAGDAGRGSSYWHAREAGAAASVDSIVGPGAWSCGVSTIRSHPIRRCTKGPTVSYYMRMPDGNGTDGGGYGNGSLTLLRTSGAPTAAMDGSTTYTSWSDFHATVAGIVELESSDAGLQSLQVHAPDHSRSLNPEDHPDHYAAADAVQAAAGPRGWRVAWYVDYEIRNKPVNLSSFDQAIKQREFYAYDDVMVAAGYTSSKESSWFQRWLLRTYSRLEQPAAPTAPTSLSASAVGTSRVDLRWTDRSSNETGFTIERAPDNNGSPGSFAEVARVGVNATSHSDLGLSAGTKYWYRVRSYNGGGNSAFTSAVSVTTASDVAAPSGLTAVAVSASEVDLAWNDNATNELEYGIHRSTTAGAEPAASNRIATLTANATTYRDQGLAGATTYYYRVVAVGALGTASSNEAAVTTPSSPLPVPAAPSQLVGTQVSTSRIDLAWQDNSTDESGFLIERAGDSNGSPGAFVQIAVVAAGTDSYSNTGLSAGTRYWYRVRAYNAAGNSPYSNETAVSTAAEAPPTALSVTKSTSGAKGKGAAKADLSWEQGTSATVDVWRNGSRLAAGVANTGAYSDNLGTKPTSYTYQVCLPGRTGVNVCTNTSAVTF